MTRILELQVKPIVFLVLVGVGMASFAGAQTNGPVPQSRLSDPDSQRGREGGAPGLSLAQELSGEGQHEPAALEYRRLALGETEAKARGGMFWAAAYE